MTKKDKSDEDRFSKLHEMFEQMEDSCCPIDNVVFEWSAKGFGFGQLYFYKNDEGKLCCHSEMMSKNFVKRMLCQMVDDAKFTDFDDKKD